MAKVTGFGKEEERVPSGITGHCERCNANVITEGNEKVLASHTTQPVVGMSYMISCPNCGANMHVKWYDTRPGSYF